jgi:phosphoribosyl 1,2-cyclic phosphate phosphodiesterase
MRVTVLGCGTSSGVPRIGGDWGHCDPAEPRNRRRRASILVEAEGYRILVDTSPDMREQLLSAEVGRIDAVLWTHDHADHCHGIDDLRQLFHVRGVPVDCYARADVLASLGIRFSYAFNGRDGYPPTVNAMPLPDRFRLGPIAIDVVDQPHGSITSAGFRFVHDGAALAYSTDVHALTDAMIACFSGVDLWIVDALREQPHPTHSNLQRTLQWIAQVDPQRALLTHMDQSMDYATLMALLPDHVQPAHDDLTVELR